ncbi:MAG: fimbrial protein, partial [Bacteriovoracaceae bacterium]|nr:fimbrial protein [Bacteriovoracaceae bacterium]
MKKLIIAASLLSLSSYGATTGDLLLQGVVNDVLSIEVTPTADATDLDIVAGESALLVATVEEKSNDLDGYT